MRHINRRTFLAVGAVAAYKRVGPVTPEIVKQKIVPLVQALNRA